MKLKEAPEKERELNIIAGIVSGVMNVDLRINSRKREYLYARYMYYRLAKDSLGLPYTDIGYVASNRDHSSVHHGLKEFAKLLWPDKHYRDRYMLCVSILDKTNLNESLSVEVDKEFNRFISVCNENIKLRETVAELRKKADHARNIMSDDEERLISLYNSLPDRLREDVMFKVEVAQKLNEKHKRDLNVIYTEG